jgi:hypothetical protein
VSVMVHVGPWFTFRVQKTRENARAIAAFGLQAPEHQRLGPGYPLRYCQITQRGLYVLVEVWHTGRMKTPQANPYKRHRCPAEIIVHCVWLYFRFCLSSRDVEELMAERGARVSHDAVRYWCQKFDQAYANSDGPGHYFRHSLAAKTRKNTCQNRCGT